MSERKRRHWATARVAPGPAPELGSHPGFGRASELLASDSSGLPEHAPMPDDSNTSSWGVQGSGRLGVHEAGVSMGRVGRSVVEVRRR